MTEATKVKNLMEEGRFFGQGLAPVGYICLPLTVGESPTTRTRMAQFIVIDVPLAFNANDRLASLVRPESSNANLPPMPEVPNKAWGRVPKHRSTICSTLLQLGFVQSQERIEACQEL
uniref:Uncharacterized protein n=1 Tax=Cannabis sativa TaxID=3483 RepID=A0A803PIS5_CANSA